MIVGFVIILIRQYKSEAKGRNLSLIELNLPFNVMTFFNDSNTLNLFYMFSSNQCNPTNNPTNKGFKSPLGPLLLQVL